jgi:hypothetical protein
MFLIASRESGFIKSIKNNPGQVNIIHWLHFNVFCIPMGTKKQKSKPGIPKLLLLAFIS